VRSAVFAVSLAMSCVTVALSGLLAAKLQDWFGVSDLNFLVIWFVPVALIAAAFTAWAFQRAVRWSLLVRYLLGVGLGLGLGFLWTLCIAWLLGPWWGAVSLPALMCWMTGGVSGFVAGLVLGPGSSARVRVATFLGLLALAMAGVLASKPLATQLSHDQTLAVRFLRWTPGSEPLAIETEREDALSDAAIALVRLAKPTGQVLVMWGGSTHGRGPTATALILLKEPISKQLTIRQPDRTIAL